MLASSIPSVLALSGGVIVAIICAGIILLLILWAIIMYNKLVRLRQSCKESWSDIDTELQRRHDLIPNLIQTVKGYAEHEKSTLEEVTRLRNEAVADKSKSPAERAKVEDALGKASTNLIAKMEAYPDLKANQNFLQLQGELSETETRIARSRRFYNANTRDFQNGVQMFPSSIIASMGSFKGNEFEFFKAEEGASKPVNVDFGASGA
ncbi:MAG: LemA family protein [Phycisphaerales bacterium]|nr:LemA family protein [Phycisphaerales bacterium]